MTDEPKMQAILRPVRWCWDDAYADGSGKPAYTHPGFHDGTYWNGFPNLLVTPATWAVIFPDLLEDVALACDPGSEDWAQYEEELNIRGTPGANGLCSIGWGYTPTIAEYL